jgi:hypothetical protein
MKFRFVYEEDRIVVVLLAQIQVEENVDSFLFSSRQDIKLERLGVIRLLEVEGATV